LGPLIQTLSFSSIPTTLNALAIHLSFTGNLVELGDWAAIDVILTTKYSSSHGHKFASPLVLARAHANGLYYQRPFPAGDRSSALFGFISFGD